MKEIFIDIYDKGIWAESEETKCGPGSSVRESASIIVELPQVIKKYNIKTIFDASCGDFNWMKYVDLSNVNYIGADIVDSLILENKEKYETNNISFTVFDITRDTVPNVDLILLKDTLFHFSNFEIENTINNIKKSGSKYILTTTYKNTIHTTDTNIDIVTGGWRYLNLEMSPFNFSEPLHTIMTCPWLENHEDRSLSLWKIEDM